MSQFTEIRDKIKNKYGSLKEFSDSENIREGRLSSFLTGASYFEDVSLALNKSLCTNITRQIYQELKSKDICKNKKVVLLKKLEKEHPGWVDDYLDIYLEKSKKNLKL